jgi:hypothetical protein
MTAKFGIISASVLALSLGLPLANLRAEDARDKQPLATIQGETEGIHVDILSLKRTEGNMLTLHIAFVNESGGPVKISAFPGMTDGGWKVHLIDYAAKRKYGPIEFSDGSCLCNTNLPTFQEFPPGRKVLWVKLGEPPGSVQKIALIAGNSEPVEDIPITR